MSQPSKLAGVVRKLCGRGRLDEEDCAAILALPYNIRTLEAASYIVREGDPADSCSFVLSGFAYRQKTTWEGAQQILSIHVPGDLLDLASLFLRVLDHNIQTLTRSEIAFVPKDALKQLAFERPAVGRAMWVDALIDGSIFREWILNVGQRDARGRIAHLLCEIAVRLRVAGLEEGDDYELPMSQEHLANAVGLTPVHVNRTLQALGRDGLIERNRRHIRISDWARLTEAADFTERYLHLDQITPELDGDTLGKLGPMVTAAPAVELTGSA